ncbi:hypothetical protein [Bradyrhizobium sp. dw_411]|uniref:hypothetical protein n=1 Tax=Bradyrhizobium sp. dw_411 TaxID=2720082 RepID=UPI001BCF014E|nr:hypothetical protein [Bradyrhizobium sp. dw_411]
MTEDPSDQNGNADAGDTVAPSSAGSPSAEAGGEDAARAAEVLADETSPATDVSDKKVSRWNSLRAGCDDEVGVDEQEDAECDGEDGVSMPRNTQSAREALVLAAMNAALTPELEAKLVATTAIALVISVQSTGLLGPLRNYFERGGLGRKWTCFARDGSDRRVDKPSVGNDTVATALATGGSVVGIATTPDQVLRCASR